MLHCTTHSRRNNQEFTRISPYYEHEGDNPAKSNYQDDRWARHVAQEAKYKQENHVAGSLTMIEKYRQRAEKELPLFEDE